MTWGAVGSAAIGTIGGAFSSGGGQSKMHPMEYIPEFLRDDYMSLAGSVQGMQAPEYYQDQLVASQNPWVTDNLAQMGNWGAGMGGDAMNAMYGAGQQGLAGIGQGMDLLNQQQKRGPNQFQYDQGTYDQAFGNLTGGLQNAFDLGSNQLQQGFEWGDLKGLNMQNALGGGQGSSKLYQDSALGQAMADQNKMNFGSNLWMNAANQANQNAMTGGLQNLSSANAFDQNAVANYGRFGQMGANMLGQGYDMGLQNMQTGFGAGALQQEYDQSVINADKAKWDYEQSAPMMHLTNQLALLPGPGQPVQGTPGMTPWEGAYQGLNAGLGIYGAGKDAGWWGGGHIGSGWNNPFGTGSTPGEVGYIDF